VAVSDEYNFNPQIAKAYFETEELAAVTLDEYNVSYVMTISSDASVLWQSEQSGRLYTRGYINYGLYLLGKEIPYLLVVRLTYPDGKLKYFREVHAVTDNATGLVTRIYEVTPESNVRHPYDPAKRTTLSLVLSNDGEPARLAWVPYTIVHQGSGNLILVDSLVVDLDSDSAATVIVDYLTTPQPQVVRRECRTRGELRCCLQRARSLW
jgi:hypothetical protein